MILPTKHVSLDKSLLGAGAFVLHSLNGPMTVTGIWDCVKYLPEIGNYGRFILILDFLYAIGVIDMAEGLIVKKGMP